MSTSEKARLPAIQFRDQTPVERRGHEIGAEVQDLQGLFGCVHLLGLSFGLKAWFRARVPDSRPSGLRRSFRRSHNLLASGHPTDRHDGHENHPIGSGGNARADKEVGLEDGSGDACGASEPSARSRSSDIIAAFRGDQQTLDVRQFQVERLDLGQRA